MIVQSSQRGTLMYQEATRTTVPDGGRGRSLGGDTCSFGRRGGKGEGRRRDESAMENKDGKKGRKRQRECTGPSSGPTLRWRSPHGISLGKGFILLLVALITAPCVTPTIGRERRSGMGVVGVMGALCNASSTEAGVSPGETATQQVTITPDTAYNLSQIFACEEGDFNVSWSGAVNVSNTIYIGRGTTVRIIGDVARDAGGGGGGVSESDTLLAELSSSLSVPPSGNGGLSSAAVGPRPESHSRLQSTNAITSAGANESFFGPMFFVDGGQLFLENMAIRDGLAINTTNNVIVSGGGVHAVESNVSVSGCEFEDNFAQFLGGAIFANNSRVVAIDTVFRRCEAGYQSFAGDDDISGGGGGIGAEETDILIDGCLFESCYASKKGGGMHQGFGQVSVLNSVLYSNVAGSDSIEAEEPIGEGAGLSFTVCSLSFDGLSACGANDTILVNNNVARKGGAVVIGSGDGGASRVELHRCTVDNSTTGSAIEDDPQGEGGAFSVAQGTTLVLDDCLLINNCAGKKGGVLTLSSGDDWDEEAGAVAILRNSTFRFNRAELDNGGVINLGEFSAVEILGEDNVFELNECGQSGGVLATTTDTRALVEGGTFSENQSGEGGGVLWVKGELSILGGNYSLNIAEDYGGVVIVSTEGSAIISGGTFRGNEAPDGGVAFVAEGAALRVTGGEFSGNFADNGGGAFFVEDSGDFDITGGEFFENTADFGGFLYKEGEGNASCTGASVLRHRGVDGGAIYAVDGATVEWECELKDNSALAGPAIYARADATVNVRGVSLTDNVVARGSVVFVVASTLRTYQVVFNDSSGSSDLSAVQADGESSYAAEESSFVGFTGEAVVFSEGTLFLDDCDFSASSAPVLVNSVPDAITIIRNAILGDLNYAEIAQTASDAVEIPTADSFMNVNVTCEDGGGGGWTGSPCSEGSQCLDGDLGVYCECYVRNSTREEKCVTGDTSGLSLLAVKLPEQAFFPRLLEGGLEVSLVSPTSVLANADTGDGSGLTVVSTDNETDLASSPWSSLSLATEESGSGGEVDGVIWNVSALFPDLIDWTIFPSIGLLRPGESIYLYAVGSPSEDFDGSAKVDFTVDGVSSSGEGNFSQPRSVGSRNDSLSSLKAGVILAAEEAGNGDASFNVTFYHCIAGNFWTNSPDSDTTIFDDEGGDESSANSCALCTEMAEGDVEGLDCSEPGASVRNLPIKTGYWRASLNSITIRECYSEDACKGGSDVDSVQDYCREGYLGPQCAVCSLGYGRGIANTCHLCTAGFKGGMYFLVSVAALLSLVIAAVLAVYLVGGRHAVSSTMTSTRESVRYLQRRSSGLLMRADGMRLDIGSSGAGGGGSTSSTRNSDRWSYRFGGKRFKVGSTRNDGSAGDVDGGGSDGVDPATNEKTIPRASIARAVFGRPFTDADDRAGLTTATSGSLAPAEGDKDSEGVGAPPTDTGSGLSSLFALPVGGAAAGKSSGATATTEAKNDAGGTQTGAGAGAGAEAIAPAPTRQQRTPSSSAASLLTLSNNPTETTDRGSTASDHDEKRKAQPTVAASSARAGAARSDEQSADAGGKDEESTRDESFLLVPSSAPSVRGRPERTRGRARETVTAEGSSVDKLQAADGGRRRRGGDGGRAGAGATPEVRRKTAAARIGEVLARMPLSKLKIVIVVWQISSAFADITQVPFPPVYEKFLSFLGIFSFDLGWILSAACLTGGIDFYDKLLIVTIGPFAILCLLAITFAVGARPVRGSSAVDATLTSDSMASSRTSASAVRARRSVWAFGGRSRTAGTVLGSESGRVTTNTLTDDEERAADSATDENQELSAEAPGGTDAVLSSTPAFQPASLSRATTGSVKSRDQEAQAEGREIGRRGVQIPPPASPGPRARGIGLAQRSVRSVWRAGPGDDTGSEQDQLWLLFARHTTMTLIILYLVYTQVSTVVFQTFACERLPEIGKSYLRADFRIECGTPLHNKYKTYAAIMICLYPLGIPAAFCYFLVRQRSRINPPTDESLKDLRGDKHVTLMKIDDRRKDRGVAPTSFLWNAYFPNRYYYEVCECIRRLLLTGVLVFLVPDTPGQVAFSCVFAFVSLLVFELLRPHVDRLDMQLYRTGCLVIFFTNFLALMIKAEVADPNSSGSALYSVVLIIVNIFFFLSIWWNTVATIKAVFSRRHAQDMMLGVDLVGEERMDQLLGPKKEKRKRDWFRRRFGGGEIKEEDFEAAPAWERTASEAPESPIDLSSRYARDLGGHSVASTVVIPPSFWGGNSHAVAAADGNGVGGLSLSGFSGRNQSRYGARSAAGTPRFGGAAHDASVDASGREGGQGAYKPAWAGETPITTDMRAGAALPPVWSKSNSSIGLSGTRSQFFMDGGRGAGLGVATERGAYRRSNSSTLAPALGRSGGGDGNRSFRYAPAREGGCSERDTNSPSSEAPRDRGLPARAPSFGQGDRVTFATAARRGSSDSIRGAEEAVAPTDKSA